ncbi:DUF5994 family protein [Streptomyces sp. NPDC018693]|uniref:DUF5994 family protein n=1 Tax=unclassified Streptomyces TaxID=2593676 RepID=UPI0037A11B08
MDTTGRPTGDAFRGGAQTYRMPLPRLTLAPDAGRGPLHGGWWPRCDALELELPALIGALAAGPGTVTRVSVDTAAWPDAPPTVLMPGQVIEVRLSDVDTEAHAIVLDRGTAGRRALLVVPPGEPTEAAAWLLTAAAAPGNTLSAPHLLALAEAHWNGNGRADGSGGT